MQFENQGIELLNTPRIFDHTSVSSSILKELISFEAFSVIYILEKSTEFRIFNFNKFVSRLDLDAFQGQLHLIKSLYRILFQR